VVLTGASSGIGAAAAEHLAARGCTLALVGRDPARLARVARRVAAAGGRPAAVFRADFADLAQVRRLAADLRAAYETVDVLVNNAGLLAGLRRTTVDGHELTMQVNHLAPFLLTCLLYDRLAAAAQERGGSRVITTASIAEAVGAVLDPDDLDCRRMLYSRWLVYGASKQANILFTVEAARRWHGTGISPTCFHPGVVRSRFGWRSLSFTVGRLLPFVYLSPRRAADTLVHLATHQDGLDHPGGYFYRRRLMRPTPPAYEPQRAYALWEASAAAVGIQGDGPVAGSPG